MTSSSCTGVSEVSLVVNGGNYAKCMMDFEKQYFTAVLNAANCNKTEAAKIAGMPYSTFCKKVTSLGLKFRVVD